MAFIHFCLTLLSGLAPVEYQCDSCAVGVMGAALRELLAEWCYAEQEPEEPSDVAPERRPRRDRSTKYVRQLRDAAASECYHGLGEFTPLVVTARWTERDACAGTKQLSSCRGPPC